MIFMLFKQPREKSESKRERERVKRVGGVIENIRMLLMLLLMMLHIEFWLLCACLAWLLSLSLSLALLRMPQCLTPDVRALWRGTEGKQSETFRDVSHKLLLVRLCCVLRVTSSTGEGGWWRATTTVRCHERVGKRDAREDSRAKWESEEMRNIIIIMFRQ